jgi:mercuric ion binding protein
LPVDGQDRDEQGEAVQSVEVDLDSLSATVIFDPAQTDAAAIAEASAQAGYPAAVQN